MIELLLALFSWGFSFAGHRCSSVNYHVCIRCAGLFPRGDLHICRLHKIVYFQDRRSRELYSAVFWVQVKLFESKTLPPHLLSIPKSTLAFTISRFRKLIIDTLHLCNQDEVQMQNSRISHNGGFKLSNFTRHPSRFPISLGSRRISSPKITNFTVNASVEVIHPPHPTSMFRMQKPNTLAVTLSPPSPQPSSRSFKQSNSRQNQLYTDVSVMLSQTVPPSFSETT